MRIKLFGKYGNNSLKRCEILSYNFYIIDQVIFIKIFDWNDKKVLITGGSGLLGSHLIERLIELGSDIYVTYRSINPKSYFYTKNYQNITKMIYCDVKDKERIFDIISKYTPDIIFHLAAQTLVNTAYINPIETLKTNIIGTINILEGSRQVDEIEAILIASSDKAYGTSNILPYTETNKLEGKYPYDVSKSCADLISQMYQISYNLPIIITRMANIFGPGDLNFSRIIPGTIEAIIKKKDLNIRSDGKMIREYIYVKDVINGYIQLIENLEIVKGNAFNLGSSNKMSVLEVVDKISSILNQKVNMNILNIAKGEIPEQFLSYIKINNLIGWKPDYTFEKGIRETYEWYKDVYFE